MRRRILALSMLVLSACVTEQGPTIMGPPLPNAGWLSDSTSEVQQPNVSYNLERAALAAGSDQQEPRPVQGNQNWPN
jgi:hypothetical protein